MVQGWGAYNNLLVWESLKAFGFKFACLVILLMAGQYGELSCPFCDRGRISALYIPGAISVKRSGARSLPGKTSRHKSSDTWLIQSGCGVCGKNQEEVGRELKNKNFI